MDSESPFRALAFKVGSAIAAIGDSKLRIVLFSFAIGGTASAFEFIAHEAIAAGRLPATTFASIDAAIVGCGSTLFTLAWLTAYRARRRKVREDVEKIAELNHHVRNALEVIMGSQYSPDSERARLVLDSVDRIDKTLRELFPSPIPTRQKK